MVHNQAYLSHDVDELHQKDDEPSKGCSVHNKHGHLKEGKEG